LQGTLLVLQRAPQALHGQQQRTLFLQQKLLHYQHLAMLLLLLMYCPFL
jgi:hypothetical protein